MRFKEGIIDTMMIRFERAVALGCISKGASESLGFTAFFLGWSGFWMRFGMRNEIMVGDLRNSWTAREVGMGL